VRCETQAEVDRYWDKLTEGGDERAQRCGWLKDKFGVSWQIVPVDMFEMLSGADREKSGRAMQAMLQMTKFDLPALRRAYEGNS
jgi:predicted 3-demethylubiquinone-9 3-methyltransferase (glyoxalase superfamily)